MPEFVQMQEILLTSDYCAPFYVTRVMRMNDDALYSCNVGQIHMYVECWNEISQNESL